MTLNPSVARVTNLFKCVLDKLSNLMDRELVYYLISICERRVGAADQANILPVISTECLSNGAIGRSLDKFTFLHPKIKKLE